MSREEIKKAAGEYGFCLYAIINRKSLQFLDPEGVNLFVDTEENSFHFEYMIPKSVFSVTCPECGPFIKDGECSGHFQKMYIRFQQRVSKFVEE